MTFDEEMIAFQFDGLSTRSLIGRKALGFDWPPPESFVYEGKLFLRVSVNEAHAVAHYEQYEQL